MTSKPFIHDCPIQGPGPGTITIFTDGGCIGNGKSETTGTRASWSFIVYNGETEMTRVSGYVIQGEYGEEAPTNNRAEYTALLKAFEWIALQDTSRWESPVVLWTDSELGYKTINEWYETWERKGTVHKMKNPILIKELMAAYRAVSVKVRHCKTRQPYPVGSYERFVWTGNKEADAQCDKLLVLDQGCWIKSHDKYIASSQGF